MKRSPLLFACLAALTAVLFSGCQTAAPSQADRGYTAPSTPSQPREQTWSVAKPSARPARTTADAPAPSQGDKDIIFRNNQIEVTKTVLQEGQVGGDIRYRIAIQALEDVGTVRVIETMPEGIQFGSASPVGSRAGDDVSWSFPSMSKGENRNIDVTVRPTAEGEHNICSAVSVENQFCLAVFAGQPTLEVVKEGPSSIELGETATWTVTVTNNGSAKATGVVVTDELPDAFQATTSLRQRVGDLEPGESATVEYSAKAVQQGEFRNRAVASYEGSGPDGSGPGSTAATEPSDSSPIAVVQSGIRVRKSGPTEAYVFKPETFEITIENTGDTELTNVRITDLLPKGASVSDPGRGRVSGDAIGWMIPSLPAGASQRIATEVAATRKGESTNTVKVITANGLEASDRVTTDWLAVPGVTISITDSKDPIRVDESTTYTIKVRNQGEFEPVTGTVTVRFNDHIRPTEVAGDAQGVIEGRTVTFPSTTLEPGRDIDLSITAQGDDIGSGRAVLNFSADFLVDPVISEESTNVY
ncbi:MAG: CARDB domain-containing protein [Opitutales bacterium]